MSGRSIRAAALTALLVALSVVMVLASPVAAAVEPPPPESSPATGPGPDGAAGVCDLSPGLGAEVCGAVSDVVSGGFGAVVGGGADAVLVSMVGFVVDGASWLLERLTAFIDTSTRPDLQSGWFHVAYQDMAVIGMLGLLPFLLLALIQAIVRQDVGLMLRSTFGLVPLAALGTAGAVVVVDLLVQLTDEFSAWVGRALGSDLSSFAASVGTALARTSGPSGGAVAGLAALIGAAVVAFAAFLVWLELLLRQAAIYVAVLFLPLGFMAMVWPATAHWVRRLAQGLVAVILSKFVIVAVMALAASALDASALDADGTEEGFGVVVAGGSLLAMSALAPYVLLRLIPVFDAGLSSQLEGTFRRPTAAVGAPVSGGRLVGLMRQRASGQPGPVPGGDATASVTPQAMGPRGAGAAPAAAGATVAVGAAAARAAATAGQRRGGQIAEVAAPTEDARSTATRAPSSGGPPGAPTDRSGGRSDADPGAVS